MGGFLICKVIKSTLHITESKLKPRFLVQCQVGAQFLTGKKKKKFTAWIFSQYSNWLTSTIAKVYPEQKKYIYIYKLLWKC